MVIDAKGIDINFPEKAMRVGDADAGSRSPLIVSINHRFEYM